MISRRVGVPVTVAQEAMLEDFLPVLQERPELWGQVMSDMVGNVTYDLLKATLGLGVEPPSSLPQLLAASAAIGLRQLQRAAIDDAYSRGWAQLDEVMRPSIPDIQSRSRRALAALDEVAAPAVRRKRGALTVASPKRRSAVGGEGLRRNPQHQVFRPDGLAAQIISR
jgi:hypothetical protein